MKDNTLLEQAYSLCEKAIEEHVKMEDYLRVTSVGPDHARMEFYHLINLCLILERLLQNEKE